MGVPTAPTFPTFTPAAAVRPGPDAARQNGEVADITYNFPAVPIDQLLDIYADLIGRTLLRASAGPDSVPATTTMPPIRR